MHSYGWRPDTPDFRDKKYHLLYPARALAGSVDLRPKMPPVVDQGNLGSCTANALAGSMDFLRLAKFGAAFKPSSRLFIYYNERVIEGTVGYDSGAEIRDGMKTLRYQGVCHEDIWPYNIGKFTKKPNAACYKAALSDEALLYARIMDLPTMKLCLTHGYPFTFGFTVYESFETDQVATTGIVPLPSPGEQVLGGHAVCAVGYDEAKSWFIVRNSWGAGWGDKGYCYMPYEYVGNLELADDAWVIRTEGAHA